MHFVISGAGEVGTNVAKALGSEGHTLAIIDPQKALLDEIKDIDALLVHGSGSTIESLLEAGIEKADVFIGASNNDESNLVACSLAKTYGAKTIARINQPSYLDETLSFKYQKIGVDVAVSPELVAAQKVAHILRAPALASAEIFAEGRVAIVESALRPDSPAAGKTLASIKPPPDVNVVAILRGEEVIVPRGDDVLHGGDHLLMCVLSPEALRAAETRLGLRPGKPTGRLKRVIIAGASRVGVRLARILEKHVEVVLIEKSREAATQAFEQVKKSLVITGDATDLRVLRGESVETADAFVGADKIEEYNILACLLARRLGVRNVVAFVNQLPIKSLVEEIGVDLALTVRQATVSSILRWCHQIDTQDLMLVAGGEAQVLELLVKDGLKIVGKSLKKADFPRSTIVGALIRGERTIIPRGEDVLQKGDRLILFALTEAIPKLERLLRAGGGNA